MSITAVALPGVSISNLVSPVLASFKTMLHAEPAQTACIAISLAGPVVTLPVAVTFAVLYPNMIYSYWVSNGVAIDPEPTSSPDT